MSADALNMSGAPLVEGKYLMYKDRPLVREGDTICYGDMSEKYILIMEIFSYKHASKYRGVWFAKTVSSENPSASERCSV